MKINGGGPASRNSCRLVDCFSSALLPSSKNGNPSPFALNGSALPEPTASAQPAPAAREEVFPSDFAGKWRVRIDGRWEGRWDLKVDERRIFGKFISDGTQSEYEINGRIAGLAHNLKMDIELANTSQSIDAFLWTKDKSAMAGTVVIAERKVGFYALREKADE